MKDSNPRSSREGFTVSSHWPLGQPAVLAGARALIVGLPPRGPHAPAGPTSIQPAGACTRGRSAAHSLEPSPRHEYIPFISRGDDRCCLPARGARIGIFEVTHEWLTFSSASGPHPDSLAKPPRGGALHLTESILSRQTLCHFGGAARETSILDGRGAYWKRCPGRSLHPHLPSILEVRKRGTQCRLQSKARARASLIRAIHRPW